jgi:hypothetical protein
MYFSVYKLHLTIKSPQIKGLTETIKDFFDEKQKQQEQTHKPTNTVYPLP